MCCANYVKRYYVCKVVFMLPDVTKFSKRGDFTGPQLIEGVAGKERGWHFSGREGGVQFSHKKQNLECLMTKNFINKNIFLCHN